MRTNQKTLDSLVEQLNKNLNRPTTSYTRIDGECTQQNEGNIHLDHSYGGLQLETMADAGVYIEFGYGRLTKGQMEDKLRTILDAIRVTKDAILVRL